MNARLLAVAVGLGLLLAARPLVAHHSFAAEFDSSKPFKFTGTVTKIEWMNPHTFFYIEVVDEQTKQKTTWGMEMGSPNILMRNGWRRDTMKIGDVVAVEGSRAKDGSPTGNARSVVLTATGRRLFAGSSQGDTPQIRDPDRPWMSVTCRGALGMVIGGASLLAAGEAPAQTILPGPAD